MTKGVDENQSLLFSIRVFKFEEVFINEIVQINM